MKKLLVCLFSLLWIALLVLPAAAAGEPVITVQPQNLSFPEGSTAVYDISASGGAVNYRWYMVFGGETYDLSSPDAASQPWTSCILGSWSASGNQLVLEQVTWDLDGSQVYCVVSNSAGSVTSRTATITILSASAAQPPEIEVPAGVEYILGDTSEPTLQCRATAPDGDLSYQWFETRSGRPEEITPISGAVHSTYKPDVTVPGTRYYVCMVTVDTGFTSNSSCSSVISVTVLEPPEPEVLGMDILTTPDKTEYLVGESLDLSGLTVRIWLNDGSYLDLKDGQDISADPTLLDTVGNQKIKITYEDQTADFLVTVSSPDGEVPLPEEDEESSPPPTDTQTPSAGPEDTPDTAPSDPEGVSPIPSAPLEEEQENSGGMPVWLILILVLGVGLMIAGGVLMILQRR